MFRHLRLRQGRQHIAVIANQLDKSLRPVSPSRQDSVNRIPTLRLLINVLPNLPLNLRFQLRQKQLEIPQAALLGIRHGCIRVLRGGVVRVGVLKRRGAVLNGGDRADD